ncbi:YfjI family protein [Sedimenticola selenatireducens]|uniref:YfjI family protein n=1 Tax=Sedimenticola selenatireducens TaxID=191960 RepID=UPI002AAA6C76|nr:YfjI family protein [Sedimenticola selenatireducens]
MSPLTESIEKSGSNLCALVTDNDMPNIIPLSADLPEVPEFNYRLLPSDLIDWVRDIAERVHCPPDFVAVTAMTALASLLGRRAAIHPKQNDDWLVICNLWGALIGRPSAMKTPAMSEGMRPIKQLIIAARKQFEEDQCECWVDEAISKSNEELARSAIKKALKTKDSTKIEAARADYARLQQQSQSVTEKRYIVNDPTSEKLGELLNENPAGLLLERDELTGWLRSLDREDRSSDRAFYLECFNGDGSYTYDRIGRGTIHINNLTLSVIGGIQPSKLRPYVHSAIRQDTCDDGLIQRLQLAVWPDNTGEWKNVDRRPDANAKERAFALFQRLDDLPLLEPDEEGRISGVHFDDEGQEVFDQWRHELENKIRAPDIHPAIESHLTKYRSLMPSLALILNECDEGHLKPVTKPSARKAAAWCTYLEKHAYRIYGASIDSGAQNAITILERRDKLPDEFTARDVHRKQWAGLAAADDVRAAISELIATGRLIERPVKNENGGRPSFSYYWNPNLQINDNGKS